MKSRYRRFVLLMMLAAAVLAPGGAAFAQSTAPTTANPFALSEIAATIFYGLLGLVLYLLSYYAFDKFMRLDLRQELVEDQNESIGIMMAGVFIGIAIIIAAAITG